MYKYVSRPLHKLAKADRTLQITCKTLMLRIPYKYLPKIEPKTLKYKIILSTISSKSARRAKK